MHKLMEKTCEALEDIERSGSLNIMDTADRKLVSELVDLKKNILKTQKLEDEMEGYSENDGTNYGHGSSYAGNRRMGGMRNGGYSSRRDSRGRYSREGGRSEMMEHIQMASDAADGQDRETLKRFMRQIENA